MAVGEKEFLAYFSGSWRPTMPWPLWKAEGCGHVNDGQASMALSGKHAFSGTEILGEAHRTHKHAETQPYTHMDSQAPPPATQHTRMKLTYAEAPTLVRSDTHRLVLKG